MHKRSFAALVLAAALGLSVLAPQAAHAARPGGTAPTVGYDVSWPQCGKRLPTSAAFAIVGLNGGVANDWNKCFLDQLAWAHEAVPTGSEDTVAIYVNTANANETASWRPDGDYTKNGTYVDPVAVNPYGSCTAAELYGPACTFVYGYSFAVEDVAYLHGVHGVPAADYDWWLDVETTNTWQEDTAANAASLEGMTAYLADVVGVKVGIYSTGYQWGVIAGATPSTSNLYSLPSWLAGSSSEKDAKADCALPPLTGGGSVAMTQYVAKQLDHNVDCTRL